MPQSIRQIIPRKAVIPVLTINDRARAVPMAEALVRGGARTIEVTLRTTGAVDAAADIISALPDLTVGVGTITSVAELHACKELGAQFAVSPGLSVTLCDAAASLDMPYLPAVQTLSEALHGCELGFDLLKFFPAKASGGLARLQQFAAMLPDAQFCPTGGIAQNDFAHYLQPSNVHCIGASWVAPPELIDAAAWPDIEQRARTASRSG